MQNKRKKSCLMFTDKLSLLKRRKENQLKAMGCTSIEELITEDFGALGTEERNAFEASCAAFIIGEQF